MSTVVMLEPAVFVPPSGRASSGLCGPWGRLAGRRLHCCTTRVTSKAVPRRKLGAVHLDGALSTRENVAHEVGQSTSWDGHCEHRKRPGD